MEAEKQLSDKKVYEEVSNKNNLSKLAGDFYQFEEEGLYYWKTT